MGQIYEIGAGLPSIRGAVCRVTVNAYDTIPRPAAAALPFTKRAALFAASTSERYMDRSSQALSTSTTWSLQLLSLFSDFLERLKPIERSFDLDKRRSES